MRHKVVEGTHKPHPLGNAMVSSKVIVIVGEYNKAERQQHETHKCKSIGSNVHWY